MRSLRRVVALALLALAVLPGVAAALSVNEVARELRCPTCNAPLDTSNSPAANDMKRFIAARIAEGWDKDRIIDAMVEDFGDQVLATPPKSGFNLVAWVVPAAVALLGLIMIPFLTRAWARRRPGSDPDAVPEVSPEDSARIEAELRRLDP
ncbi:MAG: cytochrome c-type biogenesis protein CcmH [Thermoleophilia bacterium]|jgi:cytochrome c-type biogenesis protein CcmH